MMLRSFKFHSCSRFPGKRKRLIWLRRAKDLTRSFTLQAGTNRIASVQDVREIGQSGTSTGSTGTDTQTHHFDWDASGKLIGYHGGSLVFERDAAGRISAIQAAGSGTTAYQSNALAQRVRKQNNLQTTATVYGDDEAWPGLSSYPLGSYRMATSNGQALQGTEYLYLPTASGPMPIAVQIGNELLAVHTDHLNTPRRLTNRQGQAAWQWPVSGFGEVEPSTPVTGWIRPRLGSAAEVQGSTTISFELRYPGQQHDAETGLYYNHHRYYDPYLTVGYTEADPIGLEGGWNRFAYVDGNPLLYIDPTGLVKHTSGQWIDCGKGCKIRIDFTFDEKTGIKRRHLHWECKGDEGECGENGEASHGGTWADAPERIKQCALKNGFNGAAPEPDPPIITNPFSRPPVYDPRYDRPMPQPPRPYIPIFPLPGRMPKIF
ncbi:RHS repeat domain-containing protein [Ottowia testudinis]|uniref:RHS repeat-associated protein n=1 Tax=Ottowia testudinis TaxID=2816950 RepID=A0A975CDF4_9BURK|nr:RHS repeat-associated core domain-containing protein [Ottowia testudinis]QTD43827.1 hypothetical protein J1M35_11775 [Ottowia testudinis]